MLRRRPLLKGAVALFATGIVNRLIGTVYRIMLVRFAGEDVIGLFQMTLPIYRVAWVLATAGIPVAIARIMADALGSGRRKEAYRYGRVGVQLVTVTALITSVALFLTRNVWAHELLTDPRTDMTIAVLPLLLFPAALCSALRGVLQAHENLSPVALSGLIEVVSRVPAVLLLVTVLAPAGPAWSAAGIALGLGLGEVVSAGYLAAVIRKLRLLNNGFGLRSFNVFKKARSWRQHARQLKGQPWYRRGRAVVKAIAQPGHVAGPGRWAIVAGIVGLATPLLFSGLINGALSMINVALIPRELMKAGVSTTEATALFGRLFGMALPSLYIPMVAIHPLVQTAIPAVAKRIAAGQSQGVMRMIAQTYTVTLLVSVGAAAGFWYYGEYIGRWLYGIDGLGMLIKPLAIGAPFVYLDHLSIAILYGLGRTGVTLTNTIAGGVVRLWLITELVANPAFGIVGALWAIMADYVVCALLHMIAVVWFLSGSRRPKSPI